MKKILAILIFIVIIIGIYNNNDNGITKTITYNGNDLKISIDGESSSTLPTSGTYYLVNYDCKNSNTKIEWNKTNYKLDISNGTKKGGITCNLEFKSKPLLSEMPVGSYVAYIGDSENGCDDTNIVNGWTSCSGKNANYVSDTDMGYCNNSSYDFTVNGWRLGYIENNDPHLISAGATDCMCTSSDGTASSSSCSSSLTSANLYKHFENMDKIALKYCNKNYAKGGVCDVSTSWAIKADKKTESDPRETSDFKKITGSDLSSSSCYGSNVSNRFACGYTNDLIDNGGYYWIATPYSTSSDYAFYWFPASRLVIDSSSNNLNGVRPVLALESSIIVIGGEGTYESPYLIDNNYFNVNIGNISSSTLSLHSIVENASMCVSIDTSVCTNYISYSDTYSLDLSSYNSGEHIIYVYYRDNNGKIIASMNRSVNIN